MKVFRGSEFSVQEIRSNPPLTPPRRGTLLEDLLRGGELCLKISSEEGNSA